MKLIPAFLSKLFGAPARRRNAGFPAAQISRLTNSWTTDPSSINKWLRHDLRTLRARSRQLARADGYASKFLHSCVANIAGANPFALQAKITRPRGSLDTAANRQVEALWARWARKGNCDVSGTLSLAEIHRMLARSLARDGEALVRLVKGRGDSVGLRLQVLDVDRLDEEKNEFSANGTAIKMGVEVDSLGQPLAYHILKTVPGEIGYWGQSGVKEYSRVPADEILHLFIPQYPEQVRGMPWMHSALLRLHQLSGFEEAAVVAARVGASKMGFYTSPDGMPASGVVDGTDAKGRFLQDAEPGAFDVLPEGYKLETFNPQFPDAAVEPFIRASLRGIAAAVGVAYHSLANDPSNVNYSTARVALLEERDMWSAVQQWYTEAFCAPLFDAWKTAAVSGGQLGPEWLTQERFESIRWQCKTWDWVDPLKDIQAEIEALNNGLTSRTRIAAKGGEDIEEILDELAAEQDLISEKGLQFGEKPASPTPEPPKPDKEDTENDRSLRAVA
jgi:lambda family phage portal protein